MLPPQDDRPAVSTVPGMVWLNGALLDANAARIDPTDRGFTLGDGVFETIRARHGAAAQLPRHFARLREGALVLGIGLPCDEPAMERALCAVLAANALQDAVLRLTLSRGPGPRGVLPPAWPTPTLLISAAALPPPLPPARVILSRTIRRDEHSPLCRIKSLNYLDSILARMEARRAGADDALLLNTQGDIAEATAGNVFLLIDGRLVTPRITDGALPGIMRARLLDMGDAIEAQIPAALLGRAEAGFLSNSLGLRRLGAIEGRAIDTTRRLPVLD